ncbi:MAG TPA: flagellar basal-body MS-ring/collar protein FliF [Vicinamibacterales bacterium]
MDPKQFLDRLKSLATSLTPSQMVTIGGAFVVVVVLMAGSAFWLSSNDWVLLFADMDPEAAADVVSRLKTQKIPFQIDQGGRSIRVPATKVDELRLEFAGQGLPSSGRIGFEIFDRTAFGATEFLEQVNYRRALEGEIARTISTLSEVGGARVHIVAAKDSLFGAKEQAAKASVVLKLKNANRPLSTATVHGISSLVAASIEGLRPEAVVIVDSFGRPLSRPADGEDGPLDGVQLERQQRVERDLMMKVVNLLEPVVGAERVRVNVAARINPQSQEETEERWDPTSVVRSRQTSQDGTPGVPNSQGGLAGARANLPVTPVPGQPTAPATQTASAPLGGSSRLAETTNYEISRTTRHTIRPRGEVARLSVAVIVDDEPVVKKDKKGVVTRSTRPRQPVELQKIQGLVAAAVGFDVLRGDQLTVENVSFEGSITEEPPAAGMWQLYGPNFLEFGRIGAVVLLGLFAFVFIVRPMMHRGLTGLPTVTVHESTQSLPQQLPKTVEELQTEIEAQIQATEAKAGEPRKMTVLTKRLSGMVQKEPEHAARLVRTWLAEEEGR